MILNSNCLEKLFLKSLILIKTMKMSLITCYGEVRKAQSSLKFKNKTNLSFWLLPTRPHPLYLTTFVLSNVAMILASARKSSIVWLQNNAL